MRHAELAELSSYLDGELTGPRAHELAEHVRTCASCRGRLAGLERTVGLLRSVGRESPPAELAGRLQRRLATEKRREAWLDRLNQWLEPWWMRSALVASAAVVLALAVILQLFATGVEQRARGTRVVHMPPERSERPTAAKESAGDAAQETSRERAQGTPEAPQTQEAREEQKAQEPERATEPAPAPAPGPETVAARAAAPSQRAADELILGERRFVLAHGAWLEAGLKDAKPDRRLTWEEAESEGILATLPELARLVDGDRPIVLRFHDEIVRVERD